MTFRSFYLSFFLIVFICPMWIMGQRGPQFEGYHRPDEILPLLTSWSSQYPELAETISLGKSAGGQDLAVLRIAAQSEGSGDPDWRPAVFVSANVEGVHLIGTEAALNLIETLLERYGSDEKITSLLEKGTVYVAPLLNPDGALSFFETPRYERCTNSTPVDNDQDGSVDEDGPDDLNGDGLITMMRVKDPEGRWVPDIENPRLMKRIDPQKGETGTYHLYVEGIDNDRDGHYNEDPAGGVELNRHFPYIVRYNIHRTDRWPEESPEIQAVTEFLTSHPNVSLILNYSRENTWLHGQRTLVAGVGDEPIPIPNNVATLLDLNPHGTYRLKELRDIIERKNILAPGWVMNEDSLAVYLGLSQSLTVEEEDTAFLQAIRNDYRDRLDVARLRYPEIPPVEARRGSFVAYGYFHYGVPVMSSDLWAIPRAEGESENEGHHPDSFFLTWADTHLGDDGFVEWTRFEHPSLGDVEIGGFAPFVKSNPPLEAMEASLSFHTEFYIDLMGHLAELKIRSTTVRFLGDSLYQVTVGFANDGWFPTSTARGRKTGFSWPITVRLKTTRDQMIYAGEPFEEIPYVGERGDVRELVWQIKAIRGSRVVLTAESHKVGRVKTTIDLR